MKSEAEIVFVFDSEEKLDAAVKAMKHEEDFKKRSDSKIIKNGKELRIRISAQDSVALRAAMNAYLRDIQIIENLEEIEV